MPRIEISDPLDPRLDAYRALKQTNATRWRQTFVVEGDQLVARLAASGHELVSVVADATRLETFSGPLPETTPIFVLPRREIEQLVGFNFHRGMLAVGVRPAPLAPERLVEMIGALRVRRERRPRSTCKAKSPGRASG